MTGYPEDDFLDLYDSLTGFEIPVDFDSILAIKIDIDFSLEGVDELVAMPMPDLTAWDASDLLQGDFSKNAYQDKENGTK